MTKNKFNKGDVVTITNHPTQKTFRINTVITRDNGTELYSEMTAKFKDNNYLLAVDQFQFYNSEELEVVKIQTTAITDTDNLLVDRWYSACNKLVLDRWYSTCCDNQILGIREDADKDYVYLYLRDSGYFLILRKKAIINKIFGTEDMSKWSIVLDYILEKIKINLL